ncbi:Paraspeckle component 1 [Trichuris trichiura]|uniref:Paraspeckle component 1 n=1 Tax=Trichuris trichiura TaxID=36087 RepID=A0A077Z612_TRITR|nr:Paraspeckle component 1 [Trichuris trichiura]
MLLKISRCKPLVCHRFDNESARGARSSLFEFSNFATWQQSNIFATSALHYRLSSGSVSNRNQPPPPPFEMEESTGSSAARRASGRCRLFVGNLPVDVSDEELRALFSKYGDVSECYVSRKGFAFVRLVNCRRFWAQIRYRQGIVTIPFKSSLIFLHTLRAVHIVDDHGRPTGEGIVEFERKPGAQEALKRVNRGVMLLCGSGRPVVCEPYEPKDEEDGLWERMIIRNAAYGRERQVLPHFAPPGTFEFDFGQRWKQLYEVEKQKREQLDKELAEARMSLENEMEIAREEYRAIMLREDLRRRQEELERLEAARRERYGMMQQRNGGRGDRMSADLKNQMGPPPGHMTHGVHELLEIFQAPRQGGQLCFCAR